MPEFTFNKLVRDKIVEQQQQSGARPVYRTLTDVEHKQELIKKIIEEAGEIGEADVKDVAAEIADVQQALDDLKALYKISDQDIKAIQTAKNQKKGAFAKGIFVESVKVADDDPYIAHYRANPERYPEIT